MDYSDESMEAVISFEKKCKVSLSLFIKKPNFLVILFKQEFFFKVKDFSRQIKFNSPDAFSKYTQIELDLLKQ